MLGVRRFFGLVGCVLNVMFVDRVILIGCCVWYWLRWVIIFVGLMYRFI